MINVKTNQGITQIKLGRSIFGKIFFHTFCFYFEDILIDTGPPICKYELYEFLSNKNITKICNTHHHEDHVGANKLLQDKMSVDSYASPLTAKTLSQNVPMQFYRHVVWGKLQRSAIKSFNQILILPSGRSLKIIPTQGHCDDHSCYFEESEGLLFTGDAFIHPKIKIFRKDEDFYKSLESLKKMLLLKPKKMLCSFNGMLSMAQMLLSRKIDYMESIKFDTLKMYKEGYSIKYIRNKLLGKENNWYYLTAGHFSKQNLIKAIIREA